MSAVQAGDLIVVHFLDQQPLGLKFLRHRNDWPLHITLLPWFAVPDEQDLTSRLDDLAVKRSAFTSVVGKETWFDADTNVSLVRDSISLHQLHTDLLALIGELGGACRTAQWTGRAYQPHVTHHDGQPVPEPGYEIVIDRMSLVRINDANRCEIIRHSVFRGGV